MADHWHKNEDGTYTSDHPKYSGFVIEMEYASKWTLKVYGHGAATGINLQQIKDEAYREANYGMSHHIRPGVSYA